MKRSVLLVALLWAAFLPVARAQYARETYWWFATPDNVRDSLAAQHCWQRASLGDAAPADVHENVEAYITTDHSVVMLFTFYQGKLVKRAFVVTPGTRDHRNMEHLFTESVALPSGERLEREFELVMSRRLTDDGILYTIEPDWDGKEAQKLRK